MIGSDERGRERGDEGGAREEMTWGMNLTAVYPALFYLESL